MGLQIESGVGKSNQAEVTDRNMLRTYAMTESHAASESFKFGNAYTWTASYNAGAADTILWLRNDNTDNYLLIDKVLVANSSTWTEYTIHSPANLTPAGTTVVGINLNRQIGKTALATAVRDETNNVQANVIASGVIKGGAAIMPMDGILVLGHHDCIAVDFVSASTIAAVTFRGFFHQTR